MLTLAEWDALTEAVAACDEPAAEARSETFSVDTTGALVCYVVPLRGEPYEHRCTLESLKSVAYAVGDFKGAFNLEDLRDAARVPWTQAAVAFAFLKERTIVVPCAGRRHIANGTAIFEDAMTEYHALREKPSGE